MIKNRKRETYIDTANGKILNKVMDYYENGNTDREYYYFNGQLHREDGPAIIRYYENGKIEREYYYLNDKFHNKLGPAIIWYNKSGKIKEEKYYLNGIECDILQEMVIRGLEKGK